MRSKQIKILAALSLLLGLTSLVPATPAYAADPGCYVNTGGNIEPSNCPDQATSDGVENGNCYMANAGASGIGPFNQRDCDSFNAAGTPDEGFNVDCETEEISSDNCQIVKYLVNGINFLSALAGLVFVFSLIFAGYQYITARDNPNQVQAAKRRILWTILAILLYMFMYAGLNWLVPGGVLPA